MAQVSSGQLKPGTVSSGRSRSGRAGCGKIWPRVHLQHHRGLRAISTRPADVSRDDGIAGVVGPPLAELAALAHARPPARVERPPERVVLPFELARLQLVRAALLNLSRFHAVQSGVREKLKSACHPIEAQQVRGNVS